MTLPGIGTDSRYSGGGGCSKKKESWDRQTYYDFAKKLRKRNPGISMTKALADDAFRLVVHRTTPSARSKAPERFDLPGLEKMAKRVRLRQDVRCSIH